MPAQAEKRVALVIGNSEYRNISPLTNPARDAQLFAKTVGDLGFSLVGGGALLDLDKPAFDGAVKSFGAELQGADVGLLYYAGHGIQLRGSNYLIPIDANPTRVADVDFQLVDVAVALRQMEGSRAKLNIVMLDACRNNPFGERGLRSIGIDGTAGLAQMQAPKGTLISYATQPGNVAEDGVDHSPYTNALVQTIRKPALGLFDTFNEVGLLVMDATGGSQQPWVSSSPIAGNFYFALPGGSPSLSQNSTPSPQPAPAPMRTYHVLDTPINMRSGPGTTYPIVFEIPARTSDLSVGYCRVVDTAREASWCEVRWHGKKGWASSCCMTPNPPGFAGPIPPQIQYQSSDGRCDVLAANPTDLRRMSTGVPYGVLKAHVSEAVDACRRAVQQSPNEPRLLYQLARSLQLTNREEAFALHSKLVTLQYAAAYDNLGWMYYADKQDPARALQLFQMGVRLGDPDSMVSLATMIDWAIFTPPNSSDVKLALLKRAGDRGHSGALAQYNSATEKTHSQQLGEQKIQQMMFGLFSNFLQHVR